MIIWHGWGILVAVIVFLILLATEAATEAFFRDEQYYQAHGWPKLLGLWLSAAVVWPLGRYLNTRPGRRVIDKESGEEIELRKVHKLFFVRMELWAPILVVLGIVFLFVG